MPESEQEFQSTSPLPPAPVQPVTYLFFDALREVLNGRRITRKEWENEHIYIVIRSGLLCIYGGATADNKFHEWSISESDMLGDDWMILPDGN